MNIPYLNSNYEDELDWEELERIPGPSREILSIFMEDIMNKAQGKVAPDTTGADYFFLNEFITRDMELDFTVIEQDFLKHCNGRLQEFNDAGWYGEDEHWNYDPEFALKKKLLRLMYNGAKLGDNYCVELIKYLYKLYHKREYNQLKRFTLISPSEIFSLSENEWGGHSYGAMGRILGMCRFMKIKQDEQCSILYLLLDRNRKEWIRDNEEQREYLDFAEGLFEECVQQVDIWIELEEGMDFRKFRKINKKYFETNDFVGACLRHLGYREDYVFLCMNNNMGLRTQMARTLAILRTMDSKREYTFEEVQRYTALYDTVEALTDTADGFNYQLGYLTGDKLDEFEEEGIFFKPENIVVKQPGEKKQAPVKQITNIAPVSMGTADEDDYLEEIATLRRKIHELEQKNAGLREQYRQMKTSQDEAEKLINKYQMEREELIALREYAYKSGMEMPVMTEDSLDDMKRVIGDKSIVIIGGHINWINKLKQQFPKWLFILPETYKTVNGKMLAGKDKVYFFTDHISHAAYGKFIAAVREQKIPFGYLGSLNIEQLVRRVYEDMNTGMTQTEFANYLC